MNATAPPAGAAMFGMVRPGVLEADGFPRPRRCPPACARSARLHCSDADLPNISDGIRARGGAGDNSINSNTIAWNGGAGVRLLDGQRNSLLSNKIYGNEGLGIDLNTARRSTTRRPAAAAA